MSGINICGNPTIDFNGGMILTLHAIRLLAEDETEHEGVWPFEGEGMANDAMRMLGVATTQIGVEGEQIQCQIKFQDFGNNYEDGTEVSFDRELVRIFIPSNSPYPVVSHALLFLVEEDYGGRDWDPIVGTIIEKVGAKLQSEVSSAVGAAVGAAIGSVACPLVGTAIGAGVGALAGVIMGEVIAAVRETESDIFPPQETSFIVGVTTETTSTVRLRFSDERIGGTYLLTLQWRLRVLPRSSVISRIRLQANNGNFVFAEGGGGLPIMANRLVIDGWETFGLIRLGDDKVALLAINGDFVSAEEGGGRELIANRSWVGEWETFRLEHLGNNRIALRTYNGQYVTAVRGMLEATRLERGEWETFLLHHIPAAQGNLMLPGQVLNPGQSINVLGPSLRTTPLAGILGESLYILAYQDDGNLVFNEISLSGGGNYILWASGTDGKPAGVCIMQDDGNLVIYGPDGENIWQTATSGNSGSFLMVQPSIVMIIHPDSANGSIIWRT